MKARTSGTRNAPRIIHAILNVNSMQKIVNVDTAKLISLFISPP